MSYKMSKRGGGSYSERIRGNLALWWIFLQGDHTLGWDFQGGGDQTQENPTLQHRYSIYTFTIFKLSFFFFWSQFFQSALISSISTQFEIFQSA